jgi:hypothetical protein
VKLFFYKFIRLLCWILEDIYDFIYGTENSYKFYPSFKWEQLVEKEINKKFDEVSENNNG